MQFKSFMEALKGNQHKLDKNKNGKVDAHDFKLLRKEEESCDKEDDLEEAKMSDDQVAEKERIVKGMKKDLAGFKARYGDRAKEVMYATATKQAMKEETVDEAVQKVDIPAYLRKQQGQPPLKLADLKRKDTISDKENLAKLRNEELDEAMINGREYASHGLMHPDHAAHAVHKVTGQSIDFYAHGTGDKVEGKVTKNDGKAVHIKDTKGTTHKFKVQRGLPQQQNEEKKDDVPFDGPYTKTKPAKNSDGTPQAPISRARALAKDAMKKQMKEETDESEKNEMAQTQLHFIKYAAEEILDYIEMGGEIEEWYQNKLSKVQSEVESLHSYIEGESRRTGMKEEVEQIDEAVESGNKGNGYHGQHDSEVADKKYSATHAKVKKIAGEAGHLRDAKKPNVMVKHYLDSVHGRHLAGNESNHEYIKKDFGKFKKSYKPEMHEGVDFDQEGNLIAEKLSFGDFIAKMNDQLLEYETKDGVYRHKGTYGGSYTDPEGADDADDKKPKQQPAEKRGRGRPAGAKSGARKITGTSKLFK